MNAATHPDYLALRRAVCEFPDDDFPRLQAADFLEENGEGERAEFIRLQVELAAIRLQQDEFSKADISHFDYQRAIVDRRQEALRRRAHELLRAEVAWFPQRMKCEDVTWNRGFVHSLTCTAADFLAHAGAIYSAQPVVSVTLAGKRPLRSEGDAVARWTHDPRKEAEALSWQLPADVFALLPTGEGANCCLIRYAGEHRYTFSVRDYDTEAAALAALSVACVTFGRLAAGLPPLPRA